MSERRSDRGVKEEGKMSERGEYKECLSDCLLSVCMRPVRDKKLDLIGTQT